MNFMLNDALICEDLTLAYSVLVIKLKEPFKILTQLKYLVSGIGFDTKPVTS